MPSHNGTACVQEPFYQPAEVLRIEPVRIFRRCHDVAKKYCQMTSLCRGGVMVRRVQRRDCAQQPLPRSERSEEHTSELQSLMRRSYAFFRLRKENTTQSHQPSWRTRHPAAR